VKPWNGHLLLEEAAGDKGGDGGEQPLDAPKLDGLPIEHGASAEEQADGESAYDAQDTSRKATTADMLRPSRRPRLVSSATPGISRGTFRSGRLAPQAWQYSEETMIRFRTAGCAPFRPATAADARRGGAKTHDESDQLLLP